MSPERQLEILEQHVVECERCPRLRDYCRAVAREKRRAYRDWEYWGRPVPGFGDPHARVLLIGLAPGAHGANRTGRMFTGDSSGDFLYRALYETGFASQAESRSRGGWPGAARRLYHGAAAARLRITSRCRGNSPAAVRIWSASWIC